MNGDGTTIGGYRLVRVLGHGTMGTVHLARPIGGIDREVAIKRVPVLGTAEERDRLRREAETLASLDHPNIVRILEVIDDGDGIAIVMAYAPNGTLAARIARGPLAPDDAVAVLAPIADALASAHRKGVFHRDLKPQNVLFTSDWLPLLADFGIARNAAHTNLTSTGLALGTAGYLDPEVADGGEPAAASDQYALAVVAYEALTGAPPFAAPTPLAVLRAADLGTHARLSADTYGPLADVIERAMHRDPTRRFPDMADFADALRRPDGHRATEDGHRPTEDGVPEVDAPASVTASAGTRAFRRRPRVDDVQASSPLVAPSRRRAWLLGGLACLLVVSGVGAVAMQRRDTGLASLRVRALPTCDPQTTAQCVRSYSQTGVGVNVSFDSGATADYRAGLPGDVLRIANWFCGTRATLAIYRPATGVVYYLSAWPDPTPATAASEPVTQQSLVEVVADRTGVVDAQVGIGDRDGNGCADLALDRDGTRTWFLPSVQTARLQKVSVLS